MSIIIPANSAAGGGLGYQVANGVRFDDGSSSNFSDGSAPGGNRQKFTWSAWVKRSSLSSIQTLVSCSYSANDQGFLIFSNGDKLSWESNNSGDGDLNTNKLFRDTSAWYHIVFSVDTTQGTAANRIKLYINGSQYVWDGNTTYPNQNQSLYFNVGGSYNTYIGRRAQGDYFDGYMSEIVFINDAQLAADSFGEFDSDSGVWKPLESVEDLTFGTSGYYLNFQNSGALGTDVSGIGNTFTANNIAAVDQTTDTCTNNFATLNPLIQLTDATLSESNLQVAYGSSGSRAVMLSNFGIPSSSGKWYMEFKISASSASPCNGSVGVINGSDNSSMGTYLNQDNTNYQGAGYQLWDGNKNINQTASAYGATVASGDIVGMAVDIDNKALYFHKNGAYQNSGSPTSGASKTGAIDFSSLTDNGFWFPLISDASGTQTMSYQCNFGNPSFSISSGNADGNGYGNFEYTPPSGYLSLCTLNLSEVLS